jgi:hypothetical protein
VDEPLVLTFRPFIDLSGSEFVGICCHILIGNKQQLSSSYRSLGVGGMGAFLCPKQEINHAYVLCSKSV